MTDRAFRRTVTAAVSGLILIGVMGITLIGGGAAAQTPDPSSPEPRENTSNDTSNLTGEDLAKALELQEVVGFASDGVGHVPPWCKTGVAETSPYGTAYCMDSTLDPTATNVSGQAYLLSRRLSGHEITEADLQKAELINQYAVSGSAEAVDQAWFEHASSG